MSAYDFDKAKEVFYGYVPIKAVKLGDTHVWPSTELSGPGWSIAGEETSPGVITLHVTGTGWPTFYRQGSFASGAVADGLQLFAEPGATSMSVAFGNGGGTWPVGPAVYSVRPVAESNIPLQAAYEYIYDQWESAGTVAMPEYTCPAGRRINFTGATDPNIFFEYSETYVAGASGRIGSFVDDGTLTSDGKAQTRYGGKWLPPIDQLPGQVIWIMIRNDKAAKITLT